MSAAVLVGSILIGGGLGLILANLLSALNESEPMIALICGLAFAVCAAAGAWWFLAVS